jgi:hypothetical protein
MGQVHVERTIAASPERVFNWLVDPANFTSRLSSAIGFKAGYVGGSAPGVGAVREVTGLGNTRFREEITAYDFPRTYSYRVTRSFPSVDHEGGSMTFTPSAGGTRVAWWSAFTYPARSSVGVSLTSSLAARRRWRARVGNNATSFRTLKVTALQDNSLPLTGNGAC